MAHSDQDLRPECAEWKATLVSASVEEVLDLGDDNRLEGAPDGVKNFRARTHGVARGLIAQTLRDHAGAAAGGRRQGQGTPHGS